MAANILHAIEKYIAAKLFNDALTFWKINQIYNLMFLHCIAYITYEAPFSAVAKN